MICNLFHHRKLWLFGFFVSFFSLSFLGLLFTSSSVSAATFPSYWDGERSYQVYPNPSVVGETWNYSGSTTSLLGAGNSRTFSGYRFSFNVQRPADMKRHWVLKLEYHINIGSNYWHYWDGSLTDIPTVLDVDGRKGTCASTYDNVAIIVNCTIAGDNMDYVPTRLTARFGSISPFVSYLSTGAVPTGTAQAITISYVNYDINSTNDPEVDLLNIQNQLISDTNSKLDTQINLQREANQQQQDQYDAEKQEESDREDEQSDSSDQMAGLFNFSISNPFAPMFALFNTGSTCVSIPTLANWLHLEQTQVCSFFPSKVISVVTPVLAISSVMLLFGFFVRWLGGGAGDGGLWLKGGYK